MLLGLILALVIGTAHAQSSAVAWIYTASDGSIVRVNTANGAIIDAYRLPLSPAFNVYGPAAIVSSGGRFVAYTAIDNLTGTNNRQLVVYDTQVGAIRFTYDLTGVSDGALDFERAPGAARRSTRPRRPSPSASCVAAHGAGRGEPRQRVNRR
ncbi:MAG: hypothetical protein HND48_24965 [Chloroflexi bacterium]|nr:hypothetical protein [Chloroflexota bacterium]